MAKRKNSSTLDSFLEPKKDKMEENGNAKKVKGHWQGLKNDMLIFNPDGLEHRSKIVGFDLDGTVITTKSGKTFPQNEHDWRLLYPSVPRVIEEYHSNGFKIVFFTNQKGIQVGKVDANSFKQKIEAICARIKDPVQVFVSLGTLKYRKPCVGMWEYMEKNENGNVAVNRSESIYVGDAAGRVATKERKKDHSAADRLFAANLRVRFLTPEECFLKQKKDDHFILPSFNPAAFLDERRDQFEPADTPLPGLRQEVIVLVGFPGCGKSKLASKLETDHGYGIVNRDTMKTWQKCVEGVKVYLKRGQSVVVDNTNYDVASRKRYIDVAKANHVDCRCFYFACDIAQASHHCKYRIIAGTDKLHEEVGTMVLRMFKSKFQEPSSSEGFTSVVKVNFVPDFESPEHRDLYRLYLCDS